MIVVVVILLAGAGIGWWVQDAPRRHSLASLTRLDAALHSADRAELLDLVVLPAAVQGRSASEQSEFLLKALNDEISSRGLAVLRKQGDYGPLTEVFPAEAEGWASQAGVNVEDCVAFKLERQGIRAEVVLVKPSTPGVQPSTAKPVYRVVRLNNVKPMDGLSF